LFFGKADPNFRPYMGKSLMHIAASRGYVEIAEALFSAGASIDGDQYNSGEHFYSSLHSAVLNNQVKMVKFLIDKGAKLNPQDYNIEPPLHLALLKNYVEIVKILVEAGADVNLRAKESEYCPIRRAQTQEMVEYLMQNGVRI